MALYEKFERPRSHSKALDDLIGRAYADSRLTHQQKAVLICLAWHAKNRAGEAYPSQSTISQLTGVCISLVGRAIKHLSERGYIEKTERRRSDGGKTSCLILIHGMQYFPEDHTDLSRRTVTAYQTTHQQTLPVSDTEASRTSYGTNKQAFLKQDSLPREATTVPTPTALTAGGRTISNELPTQERERDPNPSLSQIKPLIPHIAKLMSYVSANRQSLTVKDYEAITRLEANPKYVEMTAQTETGTDPDEIRGNLQKFFNRRVKRMQPLPTADFENIVKQLRPLPPCLVSEAFKRLDAIYKLSWSVPPTVDHIMATIKDELRVLTLLRNSQIAFEDAKRLYEARQRQRNLPTVTDADHHSATPHAFRSSNSPEDANYCHCSDHVRIT